MAEIRLGIVTDAKGAIKDIRELAGATGKLGGKSLSTGISFAKLTGSIIGAQAILRGVNLAFRGTVGTLLDSVKVSSAFNQAFTESTAIMGDLSDVMRSRMVTAADEVARSTTFSATEAAKSFFFLASAGLDAEQSISALPKVAAFAQAGAFDLARATDLLTDAQSALGLAIKGDAVANMENMVRVSDVLVKANTLANASVEQFSTALTTKAGAALKILGKDVEEGIAVLAAFADQGVKGAEAGTALNIVLRDLSTKAIDNAKAFKENKIAVFDSAGEMNNIADIVGNLEDRLRGMSDEQAKVTLKQLGFADKSVIFIQTLIGMSDRIREYEEQLRNAGGTTDEIANNQLQSFAAKVKLLKNNWEIFQRTLGDFITQSEGLKTAIIFIIDRLTELENSLIKNREKWIQLAGDGLNLALGAVDAFLTGGGLLITGLGKIGQGLVAVQGFVIGVADWFVRLVELIGKVNPAFAILGDIQRAWIETAKDTIESQKGIADGMVSLGESSLAGAAQIDILQEKIENATKTQLTNVAAEKEQAAKLRELRGALAEAAAGVEGLSAEEIKLAGNTATATGAIEILTNKATLLDNVAKKLLVPTLNAAKDPLENLTNQATLLSNVTVSQLTPGIQRVADETEKATQSTILFSQVLEQASNLTIIFGRTVTSVFAQASSSIGGFLSLFGKDDSGKGGFGKFFGLFKTEAGKFDFGSILSGIVTSLPAIGAIAGPVISLVTDLFGSIFKGANIAETVENELGVQLSEGLENSLANMAKQRGGDLSSTAQLAIGDIFREALARGEIIPADKIAEEIGDIFSFLERGDITKPEAITALESAIPLLIERFEELGPAGQEQISRIISAAELMGVKFEGLDQLVAQFGTGIQLSADQALQAFSEMGGSIEAFNKRLQNSSVDAARAMERLARIMAKIGRGGSVNETQKRFLDRSGLDLPPGLQYGGFVAANPPFGTTVRLGERENEFAVPQSQMRALLASRPRGGGGGGGNTIVNISINAKTIIGTSRQLRTTVGAAVADGLDRKRNSGGIRSAVRRVKQ